MPLYRVNNAGSIGFIDQRDLRPHELPPNAWNNVSNARMINGSAIAVPEKELLVNITDTTAHAFDYYTSPGGEQHIYVYADGKIYSINSANTVADVTKVGLVSSPYPEQIWITDQLNSIPVATNNRDAPQCFYNPTGTIDENTVSQDFPNWPSNVTCRVVVAYKNFLVALNIVDNDAFPNMIWWSDAAEPGKMPDSWDYADPTNLAGRTVLGAESGAILAAAVLRDSLIIYTEYSTYRMDFVGGQFVMRFTRIFQNSGIFGPRCVGKYAEKHFVITKSDIIAHDGQQSRSVGDSRVRNRFFEGIEDQDFNRVWVSPYLTVSEMWCGVPVSTTDKSINTAVVWQWDEGAWALRDLPNSRYMRELPIINQSAVDDTWDLGPDVGWDSGPDTIWDKGGTIGDLQPVISSTDGNTYVADVGTQVSNTQLIRDGINLTGDETTEMITRVYPRMRGSEPVEVCVGWMPSAEGPVTWTNPQNFDPESDYKLNFRANGRRHAIKFTGKNFDLEGYDIEFTVVGRR